jgi:hypothetical protein
MIGMFAVKKPPPNESTGAFCERTIFLGENRSCDSTPTETSPSTSPRALSGHASPFIAVEIDFAVLVNPPPRTEASKSIRS